MELPHIEHFYREMKAQGFGLLTITKDKAPDVLKMVEYNGITHPIVSDTTDPGTGQAFEKYRAYDGKHYLIDGNGTIVATFSKLGISMPVLKRALARHGIDVPAGSAGSEDPVASRPAFRSSAPVEWRADPLEVRLPAGSVVNATVRASVAPGWRIYALGEFAGPEPLVVTVASSPVFAMKGAVRPSAPTVKFDPNLGKDVAVYEDHAVLNLQVAVASAARPGAYSLRVDVRFQACNATVCLPPKTETLTIPVRITSR